MTLTTQGNGEEAAGLPEAPLRLELYQTRVTETTARIKFRDHATDELGFHIYNDGVLIKTIDAHEGRGKVRVELDGLGDEDNPCGALTNITVKAFNDVGESEKSNRLLFLTQDSSWSCETELTGIAKEGLYELRTLNRDDNEIDEEEAVTLFYIKNEKITNTPISYIVENTRHSSMSESMIATEDHLTIELEESRDSELGNLDLIYTDTYDIKDLSNITLSNAETRTCKYGDLLMLETWSTSNNSWILTYEYDDEPEYPCDHQF